MSLEQRRNLLIELLSDPEEEVRAAAAEALERLESFQDLAQIVEDLASDKRGQRIKAIFAMEYVKSADVFPHLITLLKDPDPDIRSAAIQILGVKAHPKSLNNLVKHLKDPSPAVRVHTAEALGHFSDVRLVPYLVSLLKDDDEQLVISAARSLGSIGSPESVGPLTQLTKDDRANVRLAAVKALSELPLKA
jgi:HEAT repeat protein